MTDPLGAVSASGYDAVGNRTMRRDRAPGPPEWDYTYDAADQLVAVFRSGIDPADPLDAHGPVTQFTYDGNGSMVRRQCGPDFTTYSWSQASTLTQVHEREGKGTVFKYDGDGRLYQELETNSSGHPDPGAGRSLTHTLDLPLPSEDSQRADRAILVPPPFELAQAAALVSPALLPASRPALLGQGTAEGVSAAVLASLPSVPPTPASTRATSRASPSPPSSSATGASARTARPASPSTSGRPARWASSPCATAGSTPTTPPSSSRTQRPALARTGIDPATGDVVTLWRTLIQEYEDRIVEIYHGYVERERNG